MEEWVRYTASIALVIGALLWVRSKLSGSTGWHFGRDRKAEQGDLYRMERLSSLRLGPQHTIHLVRVGGQSWLIGCSPASAALIGQIPASAGPAKFQETL